jgi:hypothetical protein
VFTARYALSSYVKRTHFVFKGLKVKIISLFKRHEKKYGGGVPSVFTCVCKIANSTVSFIVSVRLSIRLSIRPHGTNSAPTGRIFMEFDICVFFENLSAFIKI